MSCAPLGAVQPVRLVVGGGWPWGCPKKGTTTTPITSGANTIDGTAVHHTFVIPVVAVIIIIDDDVVVVAAGGCGSAVGSVVVDVRPHTNWKWCWGCSD